MWGWRGGGGEGRGVLNKILYGETLPRGQTPYPFIYHFDRTGTPFVCLLSKLVRQSELVQSAIYGSDTVVTHSQLGLFPLQNMSGQKLDKTSNLSSVYVYVSIFLQGPSDNLQLPFGKTALNFIVVLYAKFRSFKFNNTQKWKCDNFTFHSKKSFG